MTLADLAQLIRHYMKYVIVVPVICAIVAALASFVLPPTYVAKASLLTNGDIALAGGFAQNEAELFSQNGIEVTSTTSTAYRTITIEAQGSDYGGCIAAANATVIAASEDYRKANNQASISTNEAVTAEDQSIGPAKAAIMGFIAAFVVMICGVMIFDLVKAPIKSRKDIENVSSLPILGCIPNRDRGERLLANVRFLSDDLPSNIAIVPVGYTGATLTCAELASAFENAHIAATRVKGSPHAQSLNTINLPEIVTLIECAPISEGVGAVYIAKEADITILCVCEWRDSRKTLSSVVEELKFAKASIGGIVLLTEGRLENSNG
ncbi:hypothetical protein [Anaerotardibacter muris]|uniref:hypothetical protein n=1 Tax=Anaerotardibacter muris TaxID=2941505 RepID=UPI00203B7689|nr:hypothetical protein [Anaerotardibacter muris]